MPTIKKPNQHFDATLYTGNGSAQTITNASAFKPDLVWQKPRSEVASHRLVDSVRGVNNVLYSNQTAAESAETNTLTAFNSNGFTGGGSNAVTSGNTAVAWQWQAGQGSTSSNTSGNVTSTVSVNTTAGFSIVTYTVTSTTGMTIGHGLGVAPKLIMEKTRGSSANWDVYHASLGNTGRLLLNNTNAFDVQSGVWNNTSPTSTVFSQQGNGGWHAVGTTCVAYCWAEVEGFSKFGSYTGNGSADGPFVYLGFRPKFVMLKKTSNATNSNWLMQDTSRETYNANNYATLAANLTSNEPQSGAGSFEGNFIDYLSNGFKIRSSGSNSNESSSNYIYMAFAESPFKYSNAR
jgi:hypothetical protein